MPELRVNVPYEGDLGAVARFYKDVIGVCMYVYMYVCMCMCVCIRAIGHARIARKCAV